MTLALVDAASGLARLRNFVRAFAVLGGPPDDRHADLLRDLVSLEDADEEAKGGDDVPDIEDDVEVELEDDEADLRSRKVEASAFEEDDIPLGDALLSDPQARAKLIANLKDLAAQRGFGGYVFDFEALSDKGLAAYPKFLTEARAALAPAGREVWVTAPFDEQAAGNSVSPPDHPRPRAPDPPGGAGASCGAPGTASAWRWRSFHR
mgnify:CR=1 FL=1